MRALVVSTLLISAAVPAYAQPRQPLPVVVVDLRGFYAALGQDPVTAGDLSVTPADLPARGLGAVAGVHLYPLRGRTISLGIGGEAILIRGRKLPEPDAEDESPPPPITQRFRGLSGNLSLNFGARDGWSYVTAGMGPLIFATHAGDPAPALSPPVKMTINYGGGARWFAWRHFAFAVDIRFYQTRPETPTLVYAGRARSSLRILSAGISIR
jgi:hypothetical protein